MITRAVFTFFIVCIAYPVVAQGDTIGSKLHCVFSQRHGRWDFGAGAKFTFLDFEDMNHALEANGLPGLESPVPCLAITARSSFSWHRWSMESGLEYSFGASKKNQLPNRQSVSFRDYGLNTRILYDALRQNRLSKIFPFVGLGISYEELLTSAVKYDNESPVPPPSQNLGNRRFSYIPVVCQIGISLEQGIKMRNRDVFVGLRGGYSFRFLQTQWDLDDDLAVDLPKPAAVAPFMAMMVRIKSYPKRPPGCPLPIRQ